MASPIVLGITIRADGSAQVRGELGRVRDGLNGAGNAAQGANRRFADLARETLGLGSALKGLAAGLSAMALYEASKGTVNLADQMKLLDGRLKVATKTNQDYITSQKELVAISLRTRTQFDANASMFSRINKSMETMGGTSRNTSALVNTMAESLRISGASAGETASVIRQTGQALASGVVRGDEFNSIMENGSRLAYALAAGLKVNVGELRDMAENGQLTSAKVINAIMSQSAVIDAEYKRMPLTVGAAIENIKTKWGQYIQQTDSASGATSRLASAFDALANNLEPVVASIIQLGVVAASVFAGKMVVSIGRYIAAKDAAIVMEQAHAAAIAQNLQANVAAAQSTLAAANAQMADVTATQAAIVVAREETTAKLQSINAEIARARATITAMEATIQSTSIQYLHKQATDQLTIAEQRRSAVLAELATLGAQQARVSVAATEAAMAQTAAQNGLATATGAAATAQRGLTAAFAINPFTGLIVSVSILVGLLMSAKTQLRDLKSMSVDDKISAIREKIDTQKSRIETAKGPIGLLISDDQVKKETATLAMMKDELGRYYKEKDALKEQERNATKLLTEQQGKLTDEQKKAMKAAESAAKKAATEERNRRDEVMKTIDALQFELEINRLSDKEKELQTALRSNLTQAVGAEREQIEALVTQIHAENAARERQQAMWGELIKNANALDELKDSAADAQQLASLAEQLHLQGLTNDAIAQRIELEKEKAAAIAANPDLDPAQVSAYVAARADAEARIQKLTSDSANKSANQLDAAYKRALENIQDSFADMFESLLSGDALNSFNDFFDSIGKSLRKAISQNLALGIQNALSGNYSGLLQSSLVFGAGLITSLFTKKSSATRELSAAENYNGAVTGTGAMAIADSFGRDRGFQFQSQTALQFNKSLQYLSDTIMNAGGSIVDWIGSLGSKLASTSVIQSVAAFFRPVTSLIGQGMSFISSIYSGLTNLVSSGVNAIATAVGLTAAGTGAATAAVSAVNVGVSAGASTMQNVGAALAVIKLGYDLFSTWSNDDLTAHKKITNSLYAVSDTMLSMSAIYMNWPAAVAAAVLNVAGVVSDVMENGFNSENFGRLLLGPLSGLFFKQRAPNAWMNTFNPAVGSDSYPWDPNARNIIELGNKSAYLSTATPFGYTQISTHELSMSAEETKNAFGGLLETVRTVDINLYNTINRLDQKFGETGRTMDFYNRTLVGDTRIATRQDTSDLNTGNMLLERYNWIVDQLAGSGSPVGQAVNAWFDVISGKFISASEDNSIMVVGIIDSLAANLEDFMQFPLQLVDLIGRSVKSVSQGGTPDSVMQEIMGVLNTFQLVKQGFAQTSLAVDENRIVSFLANVNAIGYGVEDAGMNLLAYGIALQKASGTIIASGNALMDTVERKFSSLKSQGFDNAQMNAFFGSFGLFANLFGEARVSFNESDLDAVAQNIHGLSRASTEAARNVIDHAIATEKLTTISRDAAIATLIKSGKLEAATVAEAEYGVSVQKVTKDVLAQMGFIQQLGYVTGQSLGEMGVSASTWQAAATNVVAVFGDLETAMKTFDDIARTFLSTDEYSRYNLATVNRGLSNLRASNPALAGLNEAGVTAALKSGADMAGFINQMAQGNGALAKSTLEYVQLLGQRLTLEIELEDQLSQTSRAFNDFAKNLHSVRSSIADNINQLGGHTSIDNVAFQRGVIDRLYKQLAATSDRAEQVSIIGEINTAIMDRYQAELDMLGQVDDTVKQIRGYLDNLKLSDKSPLTNAQKFAEAQAQFATQLAMANAGDREARANITSVADAYLAQAQTRYASSQSFIDIFNYVTSSLEKLALPTGMDEAAYKAESIKLQNAAISELQSLDKTLRDIHAAEQTANAVRQAELVNALASGDRALLIETAMNDATMALGRTLTNFESQWIKDQFNSGRDKTSIYAEAGQYIRRQPHGSHANGLDYVPFDGYRAELHKGERVLTAAQARRQDGENSQALIDELRALRAEVAQLRAEQRDHTGALIQSNYDANDRASERIVAGSKEASKEVIWANKSKAVVV